MTRKIKKWLRTSYEDEIYREINRIDDRWHSEIKIFVRACGNKHIDGRLTCRTRHANGITVKMVPIEYNSMMHRQCKILDFEASSPRSTMFRDYIAGIVYVTGVCKYPSELIDVTNSGVLNAVIKYTTYLNRYLEEDSMVLRTFKDRNKD